MDAIRRFFEGARTDSGLQGELLGELAYRAPEVLAEVANGHGYDFSADDLRQLMADREVRSVQGEVFWVQMLGRFPTTLNGEPFAKISGPSWVKQAPYRKPADEIEPVESLQELYRDIESKRP